MASPKYSLNKEDAEKILKGEVIACGGALLTYIAEIVPQVDFGAVTPVVVAIASIAVNTGWKFLRGQQLS